MATPMIQFSWTADDAKTIYSTLGVFKLIITQADKNQIKKALSPGTATAVDELALCLLEEPERIRLIQSTMDRLRDWLLEHAASDITAARTRLDLPDDPPVGGG